MNCPRCNKQTDTLTCCHCGGDIPDSVVMAAAAQIGGQKLSALTSGQAPGPNGSSRGAYNPQRGQDHWASREARTKRINDNRSAVLAEPAKAIPATCQLVCADFRKVTIPAYSVDLFLLDLPWGAGDLDLWPAAGEIASSALHPKGLVVAQTGIEMLARHMAALSKSLTYQWLVLHDRTTPYYVSRRNIKSHYRPVLVYGNTGRHHFSGSTDRIPPCKSETIYDDWQQPLPLVVELVERFSHVGSLICDLTCGTGTNAVAAIQLGRRFLGFDIEPGQIKIARHRVATEA